MSPPNVLTVDVEDWYHDAEGLQGTPLVSPVARVAENLRRLLDLLDESSARATLFVLGSVAAQEPRLIREAAGRGHEIASHGDRHRPLRALLRREFAEDITRSRQVLEDATGERILGFRAPYFSIKAGVGWPLEILREAGFLYDSSILPIDRAPGLEVVTPRVPYRASDLWEVPIAMPRFLFWNLPLFGGASLRVLPPRFVETELRRFRRRYGTAVLHVHPWELDPGGPEAPDLPRVVRFAKQVGRSRLADRLRRLASLYGMTSIREAFPEIAAGTRRPSA